VHQVGFSLHNYIEMRGQQNIKLRRQICQKRLWKPAETMEGQLHL